MNSSGDPGGAFHVNGVVRHVATGSVDLLDNVDAQFTDGGGDGTQQP